MADEDSMLIKLCTENVYNDNIFHLLGLQTTATPRQIRRRREDLESAHDMGEDAWKREFRHLLGNRFIPTFEEVQAAFEHLADPEYRIVSEFFWMWPIDDNDLALKDLIGGKRSAAIRRWEQAAVGVGKKRSIAQHNLAIVYQFYAIDAELQAIDVAEVPDDFHRQMCDYWTQSFSYWEDLADSDEFWNIFEARMCEFDDPRLTGDFVRIFRKQFPVAFGTINARLASEYAKRDKVAEAKRHVDYMLKSMNDVDDIEETLRVFFRSTFKKITLLIEKYDELVKNCPQKGLDAANKVIDATTSDYDVICGLFGGEEPTAALYAVGAKLRRLQHDPRMLHSVREINAALSEEKKQKALLKMRESLYDPVVKACFNYLFKYSEATKDWGITIEWDDFLRKLAMSEKLRDQISKDLRSIYQARANDLIDYFVVQVKDNANFGLVAARQLLEKTTPLIKEINVRYGEGNDLAEKINNCRVGVCRGFVVAYGNKTNDWKPILELVRILRGLISKEPKLLKQLDEDIKFLEQSIKQDVIRNRCWHCHASSNSEKIVFSLYGNVHYGIDSITEQLQREWEIQRVQIPLCRQCKMRYFIYKIIACATPGLFLAIISSVALGTLQVAFVFGFLGVLVGVLCSRAVRKLWFSQHPEIKRALAEGFKYGTKPSDD